MPRVQKLRQAVLCLMFLSGASALVYEVVWLRLLSRAFGVTFYAVSTLVALYMGGLALGSAWASTMGSSRANLRLYAGLEAAAGLLALISTAAMARLPAWIASLQGGDPLSSFWRILLAAPLLLPPTFMLGGHPPHPQPLVARALGQLAAGGTGAPLRRQHARRDRGLVRSRILDHRGSRGRAWPASAFPHTACGTPPPATCLRPKSSPTS